MHVWIMGCDDLSFITKKCGSLSLSPKKGMEGKVCSTSLLEVQHLMIPNLEVKPSCSISCIHHKWFMGRDLAKSLDALDSQSQRLN
jgi:hypothetical protein